MPNSPALVSALSLAARNHGVVSTTDLEMLGIDRGRRSRLTRMGVLQRVGTRAYVACGSADTWHRRLIVGLVNLGDDAVVAGRSAARLHRLDGFTEDAYEFLVPRQQRRRSTAGVVRSTSRPIGRRDIRLVEGVRCVTAERLILDAWLFRLDDNELENAIDAALRLRLMDERRLRTRLQRQDRQALNHSRALRDALIDAGGESRLERWLLRLVREAGLTRPATQRTFRAGNGTIARVDATFGDRLIVEVEGHATHSSRRQRQADEERRTGLILRGYVVLAFTYNDVRRRPQWVADRIGEALVLLGAA